LQAILQFDNLDADWGMNDARTQRWTAERTLSVCNDTDSVREATGSVAALSLTFGRHSISQLNKKWSSWPASSRSYSSEDTMLIVTIEADLTEKYKKLLEEHLKEPLTFYGDLDSVNSFDDVYQRLQTRITSEPVALFAQRLASANLVANAASAIVLLTGKRPLFIRFWAKWDENKNEFCPTSPNSSPIFDFI
jgi:hypothetical protein